MTTPIEDRVGRILRRQDQSVSSRANWESMWQEIADRIAPDQAFFTQKNMVEGSRRTQRVFDSTPQLALGRFAAAVQQMVTPHNEIYQIFKPANKDLEDDPDVKAYFDELNEAVFQLRYNPDGGFIDAVAQAYRSIGAFGNAGLFVDEDRRRNTMTYRALHLSELHFFEDAAGRVNAVHRPFQLSARQVAMKVKNEGWTNIPDQITKSAETAPDQKFDFLHCVEPNDEIADGRKDYKGMEFASCYISMTGRSMVSEGGYHSFPYPVARYVRGPREVYARSVAMDALPSILTLNEQKKTVLRAGQKAVDPPLLLQDDGALQAFDLRSGALNYGTLNAQGVELVKPLDNKARLDIGVDMMGEERKLINDHFLVTLFQILVESPEMTATEALLRAQEKGALLAPTVGRIQADLLGTTAQREIDMLHRTGRLPRPPDALIAAGGNYTWTFDTILTRMQRSGKGVAILNFFNAIEPIATAKPDTLDKIDGDATLDELADVYGIPQKILVSDDKLKQIRDAKAQRAQAQDLLTAAPIAAGAAKDLAHASNLAASSQPTPAQA